ncbi:MAG: 6-phosphogluconolactonase [Magnetospirillum sp. WYHS-4]
MLDELAFPDLAAGAAALADALAATVGEAIASRGRASIALSGGRTPERVLPRLAAAPLPWDRVSITLADERWVDPGHPDSNEGLVRRLLLDGSAGDAAFSGLYTGAATPWAGQAACEARLSAFPFPLDAVFLGMGPDGHIASLFPAEPALRVYPDCSSRCVAAAGPAGSHPRMSLSPRVLLDARRIFLILSGTDKRTAYEAAKRPGSLVELPVRLILHQDRVPLTVFLTP